MRGRMIYLRPKLGSFLACGAVVFASVVLACGGDEGGGGETSLGDAGETASADGGAIPTTPDSGQTSTPDGGQTTKPDAAAPAKYAVGGTVTGLEGTGLVLQDNAGDDLAVAASGGFTFATKLLAGADYAVTVKTQPTQKWQTCTVTNGTGKIGSADVTNVAVACAANAYKLGGTVTGLPDGVAVEIGNGADKVMVTGSVAFQLAPVASGDAYDVKVVTQPADGTITCTVANGGDTMKGADVTLAVTCEKAKYPVGGNVTGLPAGESVVLQINGAGDKTINADSAYSFLVETGTAYAITVKTQPASRTCFVSEGTGTVATAPVTNVMVRCGAVSSYTVGSGPTWTSSPPSYTCLEACALKFGGAAADYSCSTVSTSINNKAWADGWGDTTHCPGGTPVDEDYKKQGANYNCGNYSCSFSAYVNDHGACIGAVNYCFK